MKKFRLLAVASLFAVSAAQAMLVHEKFAADPALDGWQAFGNTNLFHWNSTNNAMDVTWDSSQTNSYFYHPLGATFSTNDSFCVQFDLQINDAVTRGYGLQLAIGLMRWSDATNAWFSRANSPSPNLFEFDYYPAYNFNGWSSPDTVSASVVDAAANYRWNADIQTLASNTTCRVVLLHPADSTGISAVIYTNGQVLTTFPLVNNYYPANDAGAFQLDTLAVISYADDGYGDSILAHGSIGNLAFASPLPVGAVETPAAGNVRFASDTNWVYSLEQSADMSAWTVASPTVAGNGASLLLQATNAPANAVFYRVRADLP